MKIEYVEDESILTNQYPNTPGITPFVRLYKVDAVIEQAVWAMERLQANVRTGYFSVWDDHDFPPKDKEIEELVQKDPDYQRAQAFLASEAVDEWRKRQEQRP